MRKEFIKKKNYFPKKFNELRETQTKKKDLVTAKHMKQAAINFTNKQLTDDQIFLLNLVQNLVPANKNTPFMDILI